MLAAAIAAPRIMVPTNTRSDFFINISSTGNGVTCDGYYTLTVPIEDKIPNEFRLENGLKQVRRPWPSGAEKSGNFVGGFGARRWDRALHTPRITNLRNTSFASRAAYDHTQPTGAVPNRLLLWSTERKRIDGSRDALYRWAFTESV